MIYQDADAAIKSMNRNSLKLFGRLKLAKFDEISLIREVSNVYDEVVRNAKRRYYEIAIEAYIVALLMMEIDNKEATKRANEIITNDWVLEILKEPDPVTLYKFTEEAERKKQRTIEALAVAQNRDEEVDRQMRYWTRQANQYAITIVDAARMQAFRDEGIQYVQWHTAEDERVCDECDPLDLEIFPINQVPPKPHYGCRCWLSPVLD